MKSLLDKLLMLVGRSSYPWAKDVHEIVDGAR